MKYKFLKVFILALLIISPFFFTNNTANAQASCPSDGIYRCSGQDIQYCNQPNPWSTVNTCTTGYKCTQSAFSQTQIPTCEANPTPLPTYSCGATHYSCTSGVSANNVSGATSWTWTCGGSSPSCSSFDNTYYVGGPPNFPRYTTCNLSGSQFCGTGNQCVPNSGSPHFADNGDGTSTFCGYEGSCVNYVSCSEPKASAFTVSASAGAGGSVTPSSRTTTGPTVSFTVSANSGYKINSLGVTCSGNPCGSWDNPSSPSVYTTPNITANGTYTFAFDPLAMSGTLTPASSTCTIAAGASTCASPTLTWTTTNPQGTSAVTSATGTPSPANGNNGSQIFTVPYNSGSPSYFTLYNNAVQLAQASVTPSCAVNTTWDGVSGTCKTNPAPVNGACGAYHYLCSPGTSSNNVAGPSAWTWTCLGSNGGTNASCSEAVVPCSNGANNPNTCNTCTAPLIWNGSSCVSPTYAPTVTTSTPTGVTQTTATGGGNTVSDGGSAVFQAGLVWSTMINPTIFSNLGITYDGWAIGGPWTSSITGLSSSTTYHVRAYATNSVGTSYGSDVMFTTSAIASTGTLTPEFPSCVIASGGSSCNIRFSWTTNNPVGTSAVTKPTNVTVATGNSGTLVPLAVKYNSETFYLYNNAVKLDQKTVYANCASGTGWDPTSGICKVGAATCANGAVNYPACTIDVSGKCLNGAYNPVTCNAYSCPVGYTFDGTSCVPSGGGVTSGTCSNPARHYTCASGTSGSNVNTPSQWTWMCNGTGGGSSASCSELKKKPKYIEN